MAVVIRLQGLPIVAGTMDIRHFFSGLTIPDGGVHIVGGEHGEAFIVFATDEDARQGMMRTGGSIKGSKVSLLLSSKTEMQNMIELSRRRFEGGTGAVEMAPPAAVNTNRQPSSAGMPAVQPGAGGRSSSHGNQAFTHPSASVTAASSSQEPPNIKAAVSLPTAVPSFPNSYNTTPTMTTALPTLNTGPPPIPPLPNMPSLPPMPNLPTMTGPPPLSSLPPVPTLSPLTQGPPVPPMSHIPQMTSMPPFNPSLPPPATLGSGLPMGPPNPMLFNPLSPLASLGIHAQMKAAAAAASGVGNPDELFVHLQNLPFPCSDMDVREFFRGLAVEGVRFIRDGQGRLNGRAIVKFFSPHDSYEAMKRGGGIMGQRFIEIAPGSERQWVSNNDSGMSHAPHNISKLNSTIDLHGHHHRGHMGGGGREHRERSRSPHRQDFCVYLKGLPYETDKRQIKDFFKNLNVIEDSVYIAYGPTGRATGEGFIEFKSEEDYKIALGAHMQYMGTRFIQVHPISRKGMHEKIDSIRKREAGQGDGKIQDGLKMRNCGHISNIPYNVSKKDVRAFLEGVGIYEESLKILTDNQGNGLGQAIFQLRTEEDVRKMERLHRQKLNGRDAFVHLVTFDQMNEIERNPPPQNKRAQRSQNQQNQNHHQQPQPTPQPPQVNPFAGITGEDFSFLQNNMGGLNSSPFVPSFPAPGNGLAGPPPLPPLAAGLGDVNLGMAPPLVPGIPGPPMLEPPSIRPVAPGPSPFGQDPGLRGLVPFDNSSRKPGGGGQSRGGAANNNQRHPVGGIVGGPQVFPPPAEVMHNQPIPGGPGNPILPRNPAGPTVVRLQNMPFTVTVDEILDFLYGYQVLPGSVCLQFSEKGMPTGEAMVAFQSHEEATAAVMDLNDRPIGSRKVKISLG